MTAAINVLVVEDDADGREMYVIGLSLSGYVVAEAADGESALASAVAHPPDVVVTDLGLPGLSGAELCRALRANPSTAHVPLIALSGRGESVARDVDAGILPCDVLLVKPCTPDELVAAIVRVTRHPAP
jgi:DNA-binding response OmpR family regulator